MKKQSKSINLVCFGFGLTAKYFVKEFLKNKYKVNLITTSRSKVLNKKFGSIAYKNFYFEDYKFDKKIIKYILSATHILISIPPRDRKDFVIENFYNEIASNKKIKWLAYLSSTSVYGNHNGKWVNENSKLLTINDTGINRIVAENEWLKLNRHQLVPTRIFRLSGIYSPERNIFLRLANGRIRYVKKSNHFFSRIHVADIAQVLFNSLIYSKPGEIYNVADNKPSSYEKTLFFACSLMGVKNLEPISFNNLKEGEMKNFYKDSKKVSNKKIKQNLKVKLYFPTYKEGLKNILKNIFNR
jgi:nucleoside-diphosphate-sugar epimerase